MTDAIDITIVGGCGHVGLPLGLAFADRGRTVRLYDIDATAVATVNSGQLPFAEANAQPVLDRVGNKLRATTDPACIAQSETVIFVIGTPIDEHLNPDMHAVPRAVAELASQLHDGQLIVLRSTVYPGVTKLVERTLERLGLDVDVAFCPERIAEGAAMTELYELPQVVGARSDAVLDRAAKLFSELTADIVRVEPEEAELAKLFTNTWRYVKFATANQMYMMANDFGLDFERIRSAITHNYPRAADLPGPGFSAGPCLLKDTMQLAAFNNNQFILGSASMSINEGLPLYLVSKLEQRYDLASMTVGILGMAFKPGSDDIRSSLSYKLKRLLRFKAERVLTADPRVTTDPELLPTDEVVAQSDLIFLGTPHPEFADLDFGTTPVVDIWNFYNNGVVV